MSRALEEKKNFVVKVKTACMCGDVNSYGQKERPEADLWKDSQSEERVQNFRKIQTNTHEQVQLHGFLDDDDDGDD